MLKQFFDACVNHGYGQPPSGGCVLKPARFDALSPDLPQPPSGGCVLKPSSGGHWLSMPHPQPPSGGCVLKLCTLWGGDRQNTQPPSGGCVLKLSLLCIVTLIITSSRLRAAVC